MNLFAFHTLKHGIMKVLTPRRLSEQPRKTTASRQAVSWYLTMFCCMINLSHLKVTLSRSRDHYKASTNHTTYLTAILESLQYKCHK